MICTPDRSRCAKAEFARAVGKATAHWQHHSRGWSRRRLAGILAIGCALAWTAASLAQTSKALAAEAASAELPGAPLPFAAQAGSSQAEIAANAGDGPIAADNSIARRRVLADGAGSAGWEGPGGRHEFGAWWGLSLISGHIWGYAGDVKYMPIGLRYSYEFARHKEEWAVRYSPEVTALAMLDWLQPDPATNTVTSQSPRVRAYGSGVSPVGFQWDFLPLNRVEPFLSMNAGFLYFDDQVLSTQGSQFMYTIDYGAGFNIFHHGNQAVTIGYRYQHLSNANISIHNPGTDANTFYVGVSRFRNKGK